MKILGDGLGFFPISVSTKDFKASLRTRPGVWPIFLAADEKFEHWIRQILDEDGKPAPGCDECLRRHPSLTWDPNELYSYLNLQAVITISPYPRSMRDEFTVSGSCIGDEFVFASSPTVTGQYPKDGKVALTLVTHIIPKAATRR